MELSSEHREKIHKKAKEFVKRWTKKYNIRESKESQTFINEFFGIFNIDRFASNIYFEYDLSKGESKKRIDVLWPGVILIENKSSGENLNRAFDQQVKEYFDMLKEKNRPKCVLVNNFHIFKLYTVKNGNLNESECFHISKLPTKVNLFYYFFDHEFKSIKSVKKVIRKTRYCILKLALTSALSFTLGYMISDGRPMKTLENNGQLPPGRPGQEVSFHPPAVHGVGVLPVKHRHRPRLAGQHGRLHKLLQVGDLPGHGRGVVEADQGMGLPAAITGVQPEDAAQLAVSAGEKRRAGFL